MFDNEAHALMGNGYHGSSTSGVNLLSRQVSVASHASSKLNGDVFKGGIAGLETNASTRATNS